MKFSIITCSKNSERYLGKMIASVSEQTFTDYEHIFIDGNSTDNTIKIIRSYIESTSNNVILVTYPPRGIANAMNIGIGLAKGEYIINLHSDDYLHDNDVLKDVANFIQSKKPDWIYSKEMQVGASGEEIGLFMNKKIFQKDSNLFNRYLLKYYDFVRHQSVYIKREVFDDFGLFKESFDIAMDYEYWLMIRKRTNWIFYDRITDCFRMHDNGTSSSPLAKTKKLLDEMRAARMYMNSFEFYILRPIFKIVSKILLDIDTTLKLYRAFGKTLNKTSCEEI